MTQNPKLSDIEGSPLHAKLTGLINETKAQVRALPEFSVAVEGPFPGHEACSHVGQPTPTTVILEFETPFAAKLFEAYAKRHVR